MPLEVNVAWQMAWLGAHGLEEHGSIGIWQNWPLYAGGQRQAALRQVPWLQEIRKQGSRRVSQEAPVKVGGQRQVKLVLVAESRQVALLRQGE